MWTNRPTTILRKACRNCTKSKRKCSVQLPSCTRCNKKRLVCSYDLEPLSSSKSQISTPDQSVSLCYISRASSLNTHRTYSSIDIQLEYGHVHYVIWVLQQTPCLVITNKISALVHPKLQFRGFHNHVSHITDLLEKAENQHFQNLLSLDVDDVPLHDAITALQSLILYLITYLFSTDPTVQTSAESHLHLLPDWASKLWTTAAHRIPANLSPHQSWLLGETTRRTILLSYILTCVFTGWKYGFCRHKLIFESLPFDGRVGLWTAESPQAWIAAAGKKSGTDVGSELVSFHEFGGLVGKGRDLEGDRFLELVRVGHNGKPAGDGIDYCET